METKINNTSKNISSENVVLCLKSIFDPEIDFSIYDIGLIYEIDISDETINIIMTLTSVNCPEAQTLPENIKTTISTTFNINTSVNVVFEPEWTIDNMNDEIKLRLGLL